MASSLTGYGPRGRLIFDGDERKYELWEVKFLGFMRLQKLNQIIQPADEGGLPAAEVTAAKNAEAFAELVQLLDDRSLSLVLRDAKDKGREALAILREHYLSKGKPRVIALYTELTTLKKAESESVTDYMIRAETAATSLKTAGEVISDSLLIAMILKGLPPTYKPFTTVVTQKDTNQTFSAFKVALRSFEETEKAYCEEETTDNVLSLAKGSRPRKQITCYTCGQVGHKSNDPQCSARKEGTTAAKKRWCDHCKSGTHDTSYCRKLRKESVKTVESAELSQSIFFKISVDIDLPSDTESVNSVLVDCGATTHVLRDKSRFQKFEENFDPAKHYIELADGSRVNNVAYGRGDACIDLTDAQGNAHTVTLTDALYIPSFKQDIMSVQAATDRGAKVEFRKDSAELTSSNGVRFDIKKRGRLYFLNSAIHSNKATRTVQEWHETLGHCNIKDVLKLEGVVDGMRIVGKKKSECGVCIEGKMSQYRNREPDQRASAPLELIHTDLAGPIDPATTEGFKYTLAFVDDYSGLIMVYFLKMKSDTVKATEKFLAEVSAYGQVKRIRSDNGGEYTSTNFKNLLIKNKIKHEMSAPHSPHQNGTVERSWRSVFDMARCMLIESKLPKTMWKNAVMTTVYTRNRCYNPRLQKTAFEAFTGTKPNISNMHTFGTVCYAYVQNKKKLDPRSEKGIFIGYDRSSPAYLVYYPNSGETRKVRCVTFTKMKLDDESHNNEEDDGVII